MIGAQVRRNLGRGRWFRIPVRGSRVPIADPDRLPPWGNPNFALGVHHAQGHGIAGHRRLGRDVYPLPEAARAVPDLLESAEGNPYVIAGRNFPDHT